MKVGCASKLGRIIHSRYGVLSIWLCKPSVSARESGLLWFYQHSGVIGLI